MLITKYRPTSFDQIYGNQDTVKSIRMAIEKGTLSHSLLLWGESGCGKTTIARIIASQLNAVPYEVNAAEARGIDNVRELIEKVRTRPLFTKGNSWLVILDEAHQITPDGQQALLKEIEEPPAHVYYILCSTDPNKLIKTLKNRLTKYEIQSLSEQEAIDFATKIWEQEGLTKQGDWESLIIGICNTSSYVPREILTRIDALGNLEEINLKNAEKILLAGTLEDKNLLQITGLIQKGSRKDLYDFVSSLEVDPEGIRILLINYYSKVLQNKKCEGILDILYGIEFDPRFKKNQLLLALMKVKEHG